MFIDDQKYCNKTDYDIIIKSYATFYEDYLSIIRIIENSPKAKIFWITNEYDLEFSPAKIRKTREISVITNVKKSYSFAKNVYFVNLNTLFYQPKEEQEKKNIKYAILVPIEKIEQSIFKSILRKILFILVPLLKILRNLLPWDANLRLAINLFGGKEKTL